MTITIGNFLFRYRNSLFPLTCLLLLLPGPRLFSDPWQAALLGLCIAVPGQIVRAVTIGFDYIVRGGRQGKVHAEGLVISGVYRISRNPMYVGNVLIAAGLGVASNSVAALALSIPMVLFVYACIVAAEEAYLSTRFGRSYEDYRRCVPRWLPGVFAVRGVLSGARFHWRRVVVKEYGTPAGWIAILCGITLRNVWIAGMWTDSRAAVSAIIVVIAATFVLWLTARVLKKMRFLTAD